MEESADKHVSFSPVIIWLRDGWSLNVFVDELAAAYGAILARGGAALGALPFPFATYATDLAPKPEKAGETEKFWLDQFRDIPDLPEMPLDHTRVRQSLFAGGTCTGYIDGSGYKALKKAGAKSGRNVILDLACNLAGDDLAAAEASRTWSLLFRRRDRGLIGDRILVGHCVNLLPLRQSLSPGKSFLYTSEGDAAACLPGL